MRCLSSPSGRRGVKIGGVDHRRGSSARIIGAAACPDSSSGGRVRSSHRRRGRGVIHGKAAHGKRPTENRQQKRGRRGAGRVYLFFRVKFSGGWNHPPPVLLSSGGWNPSRAILSRVACKIYPCMLCPDAFAAAFIAFASGVNGFRFICVHFALYLSLFSLFLADTAIILPLFIFIYKI